MNDGMTDLNVVRNDEHPRLFRYVKSADIDPDLIQYVVQQERYNKELNKQPVSDTELVSNAIRKIVINRDFSGL